MGRLPSPARELMLLGTVPTLLLGAGLVWALERGPGGPPEIRAGATLTVDREALAEVDLAAVHEELVTDWVLSSGGMKSMQFRRIRREAGKDPNLGALLDRMELLMDVDPVLNAPELLGLVSTWNAYLTTAGEPWRLAGEVQVGDGGGQLLMKAYRVIWREGTVRVGDHRFPAEIRRRADRTSLPDAWLGHMHDHRDGVVILLDGVTGFALDHVWPLLDPLLEDELDPLQRAFAPSVRAEVAAWLTPEELAALEATAEDRYWMNRAAEAIHGRHQCGAAFYVARVPWDGMSGRDLATLQQAATLDADAPCPDVTETEALVFAVRSSHVRHTPGVRQALEHLAGLVGRAVAVHEARHAADDLALDGQPIPCLGCPPQTTHLGALEGSAYAASFAHPETGALAMYQACALDPDRAPERTAMVSFLAERLDPHGCAAGAPDDRVRRAEALQREIFGRAEPVSVPELPSSLPVGDAFEAP
ncbi:MAG: hypothetical protein R3F59_28325 [Myxococcota bacterium]